MNIYKAQIDYSVMNININIPPNLINTISEQEFKKTLIIFYGWMWANNAEELKKYYQEQEY